MTSGEPPGYGQEPGAPWPTPMPTRGQPVYGQPVYGQPVYGQPVYGQPVYGQQYGLPPSYAWTAYPTTNTLAIVSFVASLANLVVCGIGSIVGIVCGFLALRQIRQTNEGGRGLAIAGIVISTVFVLLAVGVILLIFAAASSLDTTPA